MITMFAVKFVCLCNQMDVESSISTPLKKLAQFGALCRSRYSGRVLEKFDRSTLDQKARVVRSLYGLKENLTRLAEVTTALLN